MENRLQNIFQNKVNGLFERDLYPRFDKSSEFKEIFKEALNCLEENGFDLSIVPLKKLIDKDINDIIRFQLAGKNITMVQKIILSEVLKLYQSLNEYEFTEAMRKSCVLYKSYHF